jgi:predicted ATPase/class 3 adenylate cyclase
MTGNLDADATVEGHEERRGRLSRAHERVARRVALRGRDARDPVEMAFGQTLEERYAGEQADIVATDRARQAGRCVFGRQAAPLDEFRQSRLVSHRSSPVACECIPARCRSYSRPVGEQPRLSTFWFSDVEGSTRLLGDVGDSAFRELLRAHREIVRTAFTRHGGTEVGTEGDSFFATFPSPGAAADAARAVQTALECGPIRVRIGIHTGVAYLEGSDYVGLDVHRAARIASVAHGGQTVLSDTARAHVSGALVDLGEHRLKDLSSPVRLFQLGEERFPALRSLHRSNLPVPSTPFLGRDTELVAVAELLAREGARIVTLTGAGGMGKTRLALQAAADASDGFPDGVWWIPLAALQDPGLVLSTIAQTLQIGGAGSEAIAASLAERLGGRRMLLVIDNAEHLLPGVAEAIATIAAIDGPCFCVTSRERLALAGEHVFTVPALSDRDAVALFVARARQLDPAFAEEPDVRTLCRQLDNLPLAIELAAARSTLFSVDELTERLGHNLGLLRAGRATEHRHRTLQAAVDWSYRLLGDEEQRVFRALAGFRGGCTVEALEQIARAEPETIGSLIDKSLVRRRDGDGGPRLFMLEMVRRHAEDLLAEDPARDELVAASARYFTELTERAFASVASFAPDCWSHWGGMRDERDNVRAALAFHRGTGDGEALARICAAEWLLWFFVGDAVEGAHWLRQALEMGPPAQLLSAVENGYAAVLLVSGDVDAATELAIAALEHARESGDARAEAAALVTLGNGLSATPATHEAALAAWTHATSAARAAASDWWEACAVANLAEAAFRRDDCEEAIRLCDELARLDTGGPSVIIDFALFGAEIAWMKGDVERAREQLVRALEQERRTLFTDAYDELSLAARIVSGHGLFEDGALLIAAATARHADLGLRTPASWHELGTTLSARLTAELGPDRFAAAAARGRLLSLDEAIAHAIELLERDDLAGVSPDAR